MRIRILFSKTDHMRYTSHLDVHRTWERLLRRARLPLSYSQGFNKRPKINLAAALPLGFTSDCELIELWLDDPIPCPEIKTSLIKAVPPGIVIQDVVEIDQKNPKIPNLVDSADYVVSLLKPAQDLDSRVQKLLNLSEIIRVRRGKEYNLRPLIEDLRVVEARELRMRLAARSGATGRPEEVLLALGIEPSLAKVHRTALNLLSSS